MSLVEQPRVRGMDSPVRARDLIGTSVKNFRWICMNFAVTSILRYIIKLCSMDPARSYPCYSYILSELQLAAKKRTPFFRIPASQFDICQFDGCQIIRNLVILNISGRSPGSRNRAPYPTICSLSFRSHSPGVLRLSTDFQLQTYRAQWVPL